MAQSYPTYKGASGGSTGAAGLSFGREGLMASLGRMPWGYVSVIVGIAIFGTAMLYSSTITNPVEAGLPYKHAARFVMTFIVMIGLALTPLSVWLRLAFPAYVGAMVLLVLVELFGVSGGGAERWLQVGPVAVQPSELMKLALIMALARYYQMFQSGSSSRFWLHIPAFLLIAFPAAFIVRQPDLGTTLMLAASGGVIIFLAGILWRVIIAGIVAGAASAPLAYVAVLKPYQRERVDTFLSQLTGVSNDPLGDGYQIEQAKIAIGSGGFDGKGFAQGIQSQLDYIPEQHTDFIFTVIAEEFGFLGAAGVLTVWGILLAWGLVIASGCSSRFGKFAAAGAVVTIAFYVAFNIGMVNGLLPVVGVPLPLISYGGTAMLTVMACFGLILSAHIHKGEKLAAQGLF